MSTDAPAERVDRERLPSTSVSGILRESVARIADDPTLAVPFLAAGLVLSAVDWLRFRDPIPTTTPERVGDVTVSVVYHVYPTGLRATGVRPSALVDLHPRYLAWTVGLELAALVAVAAAGWYVIARAEEVEPSADRLAAYLGFVVTVRLAHWFFGFSDGFGWSALGWLALVALVVLAVVYVRLFAAPALVVAEDGLRRALGRSARLSTGEGATVFGLVVLFGVSGWLLGSVPAVGALLSSAVVAPVHAVAVVVFGESAEQRG